MKKKRCPECGRILNGVWQHTTIPLNRDKKREIRYLIRAYYCIVCNQLYSLSLKKLKEE